MSNAEWDPEIEPKLRNLFDSLKISGISPVAAEALRKNKSDSVQGKVLKAIQDNQRGYLLQPVPDSKEVGVVMPGLGLGFKVESDILFARNFSVTVLKDLGTFVSGGLNQNQHLTSATHLLSWDESAFTLKHSALADSPYPHSSCALFPYNSEVVISVGGD